jgi:hypothetical protein
MSNRVRCPSSVWGTPEKGARFQSPPKSLRFPISQRLGNTV